MNANEFKDQVRHCMRTGSGLSQDEFTLLDTSYDTFGFLFKYALSSWMVGEFPELDAAVRADGQDGWETYKMLGGPTE
jgi:hypothetical protein